MNSKHWQHIQLLPLALMGLMALTRFHHFGSAFSLPDASLAVFFLAGMGASSLGFFALLLVEAGVIDYLAIHQFGVSDYCISPAYLCLIPTYGVMWFAGHYWQTFKTLHFVESLKLVSLITVATTFAFIISNGSFYSFSGKFADLSWLQYGSHIVQYYPLYLGSTLLYGLIGYALVVLIKAAVSSMNNHKTVS